MSGKWEYDPIWDTNGRRPWYRVVGSGRSGPVTRSIASAWLGFDRAEAKGSPESWTVETADRVAEARRAEGARLVIADTRRAALDAGVSRTWGRCGRGHWQVWSLIGNAPAPACG